MFHKKNIALLFLLCLKMFPINTMEEAPTKFTSLVTNESHPKLFTLFCKLAQYSFLKHNETDPLYVKYYGKIHESLEHYPNQTYKLELINNLNESLKEIIISSDIKNVYFIELTLTPNQQSNNHTISRYAYCHIGKRLNSRQIKNPKKEFSQQQELHEEIKKLNNKLSQEKKDQAEQKVYIDNALQKYRTNKKQN